MPRTRTSSAVELLIPLDRTRPEPLNRQLRRAIRDAIQAGRVAPLAVVPSTRALAAQLGVSRGLVVEAYEQLIAEGYLVAQPGGITRVASAAASRPVRAPEPETTTWAVDFRPGRPDLGAFPRAAWLRSIRRVLEEAPSERFGYQEGRGMPETRAAVAAYLDRVRGTSVMAADTIMCTGFAQGLRLTAEALVAGGARSMAVEDPSDPEYRDMIRAVGLEVVAIPVDDDGLRVDRLEASDADAVLVTAAHQYPTGAVLPPERRAALVAWAVRRGGWIVEDDYDAEFRYDREPIGAIQGLAPDRVVYAGSASKTLIPGLRLGWLVAPADLVATIAHAKAHADLGSSAIDQLAFADFLERGELDRHLRRMRPIYRRRRDVLLEALARHLPMLRPVGASAGLHLLAWLPADLDEAAVVQAANDAGIGLSGLAPRRVAASGPGGVIFGYGLIDELAIDPGIRALATVVRGMS